jgi:multidrug resistance efflux pump
MELATHGAGPEEDAQKWAAQVSADEAAVREAQAELAQARYYLDNTLMVAPEDGYIINLHVRPGMVAGDIRLGAIASFVCDADRYLLANFFQENLKYVKPGQSAEVALDLYPGQIWKGKVEAIWQGSGAGQMVPSGTVPNFAAMAADAPQGQFAVAIRLEERDPTPAATLP